MKMKTVLLGTAMGLVGTWAQAATYTKGVPAYTMNATTESISVDGNVVTPWKSDTLGDFKVLKRHVRFLSRADRAIETEGRNLELYDGRKLLLAIDMNGDSPTIVYSRHSFGAEGIQYTRTDDGKGLTTASAVFSLRECHMVDQAQEQLKIGDQAGQEQVEQGQTEQGQAVQVPSKEQTPSKDEVADEALVKGEPPMAQVESCMDVVVTKDFEYVAPADKGQEQQQQQEQQEQQQEQTKP